jgi:hypothetical protein
LTSTLARDRRPRHGSSFLTLASVSRLLGILFPARQTGLRALIV